MSTAPCFSDHDRRPRPLRLATTRQSYKMLHGLSLSLSSHLAHHVEFSQRPNQSASNPDTHAASAASSVPQYSFGLFDPNTIPQSTPLAANRALSALLTFPPPGGPLDDRLDAERAGLESEDDPQVHDDEHPADEDDDSPAAFLRRQQRAKATEAASIDPFLMPVATQLQAQKLRRQGVCLLHHRQLADKSAAC